MLIERPTGIGGSDVPAILGVSPWATPLDVWLEKTKHPGWRPKEESPEMRWGTLLEPVMRLAYEQDTGRRVFAPGDKTYWADDGYRYAHLDGLIEGEGIWEGKVPFNTFRNWVNGPPVYVLAQVQHYLDLVGEPWCDVSALLPGADFQTFRVPSDPEAQEFTRQAVHRFWTYNVAEKVPPATLPANVEFPRHAGDLTVIASEEDEELAQRLHEIRSGGKANTAAEEEVKEELKRRIGQAAGMTGQGWRIRWKANRDGEKTDWKLVAGVFRKMLDQIKERAEGYQEDIGTDVLQVLTDSPPDTIISLYTTKQPGARPFVFEETE
jgi:putative phage-type endonuclease